MSNNFREEEALGKAFDTKLMKRLLNAKPYAGLLLLCIFLLVLITGTDPARPYLIKIAIDNFISAYDTPMAEFAEEPPCAFAEHNGKYYVRETLLPAEQKAIMKNIS